MKKRVFSALLAFVMVLAMVPAMATPASAASTPTIVTEKLTTNMELQDNTIYVVSESYKIGGKTGKNGLRVKEGAQTVIYIAKGVTLTVEGGDSVHNGKGGKAGILLPSTSTLTITGQGKLVVTGGDGASAARGDEGTAGEARFDLGSDGNDDSNKGYNSIHTVLFTGGAGGNGGHGAGGGGAAIGTDGGAGGAGGQNDPELKKSGEGAGGSQFIRGNKHSKNLGDLIDSRNAKAGKNGDDGSVAAQDVGSLYIVGDVSVTATGGQGGSQGGAGTSVNTVQDITFTAVSGSKMPQKSDREHHIGCLVRMNLKDANWTTFCIGAGGAGGGGGAGGDGAAIGTGGTGGGGGGAGGGGGVSGTDKNDSNNEPPKAVTAYGSGPLEVGRDGSGGSSNGGSGTSPRSGTFGLFNKGHNTFGKRVELGNGGTGGAGGGAGAEARANTDSYRVASTAKVNGANGVADPETLKPPVAYHTFTVHKNNGTGQVFSANVVFGTTETTVLQVPTYVGHTFRGYFSNTSNVEKLYDAEGKPTNYLKPYIPFNYDVLLKCTQLSALWDPITYTVNFYNADGTELLNTVNATYGQDFKFYDHAGKAVPDGKTFSGWSKWPYASNAIYDAGAKARNLTTTQGDVLDFYAVYQDIPDLTITYNANGGSGAPASDSVPYGGEYTIPSDVPTRDGYTFQCWQNSGVSFLPMQPGGKITNLHISLNLYAVWKHNPSVTYDANGGYFTTSLPVDYPSPAGTYTLTDAVPVREGYDFKGWKCSKDGNTYSSGAEYALGGSYDVLTFTAQWEKKIFRINVNAETGITYDSGLAGDYEYGTDKAFTATGDGTVRVYANGVLLSPQDDGQYHITVTQDIEINITLTRRAEYYIVSYDPNGGVNAPFDRGEYAAGENVTVGDAPTREGYTFTGWSDVTTIYQPGNAFRMGSGDVTLTAQWTANGYSIVYNANGGEGGMGTSALTYDQPHTIAECTYHKTGYRFTGWALSPDGLPYYLGGETVRNLTAEADSEITLYAIWTPKEYTVTLDAMDGTPAKSYVKATYDAEMPAIALPTRTGYIFGGYYDAMTEGTCYYDNTGASMSRWNKDADATLYARWTPISYSVSYDLGGAEGFITSTPFTYDASSRLPAIGNITLAGYRFAGWALSRNGSVVYEDGATVKNLASEQGATVTLYAVWEPLPTYTLHYDANGGTAAPADGSALEGENCTVSDREPVYDGCRFLGWSTDPTATQPDTTYAAGTSLTMTGDLTLYAVWYRLKTYTITYAPGVNDGSVSNLPAAGTKTENEPYLLSSMIPVREGYDFAGWSINGINKDYEANDAYDGNAPLTLYALWEVKTYGLTLRDNGVGTITVLRGGDPLVSGDAIRYGDVLDITAEPLNGYSTASFWCLVNGSIITTGDANQITTQLTVTGDAAVTLLDARSTEVRYTVKYDANGGTGSIADQTVNSADTTQLSDGAGFTKDHADLIGWATAANGGVAYALGAVLTAPIAADGQTVTLYAVWQTHKTYTVSYDANGGIGAPVDRIAYFENDTVTVSTVEPTHKGYIFRGWNDGNAAYQPGGTFAMPTGNVTLTAQWEREKYTVTVDAAGVANVTIEDAQSEYPGDTLIRFTVEAVETNVLSALTVAVNGSVMQMAEENGKLSGSFTLTQNTTITVRSGATTYTVTYDANGGTPTQAKTAACITGASVTLHSGAGYARNGYRLTGWNTAPNGSGTAYALGALVADFGADTTLYAVWADERGYGYTVVYDANDGDGADQQREMYENVLSTPLYDGAGFTKDHADLIGWATAPNGGVAYALGAVLTAPIAADGQTVTLYAVWQTHETYTVSYDANGGIGAPVDRIAYFENDTVNVLFTDTLTRSGWTFLGWDTDRSARIPTYTTDGDSFQIGAVNVTLYAIWQQNASTYTVRYDANGGTGIPTDENAYLSGESVIVKFTPQPSRPDWTFLGWARSSTASTPEFTTARGTFQMGSGDVTLYAVWQKIQCFTVTYDANAGGELVTALPGAGSKTAGADYTVSPTVPARSGYTFLGWSRTADGAVEFAPGAPYTEDADLTLYAVWERITYTVSIDDGGVADVALTTNPNQNRFPGGTTVDFTVTALDPNVLGSLTVAVNGAVMQMTEASGVLTGSFVLERDSVIAVRSGATTYTVAYDANGGDTPAQSETAAYVTGTTLVLHDGAGFTKNGYHISGWNTASDGNGDAYALAQVLTSDLTAVPTLYAVWEADPDARGYSYTVSYDPNGGTGTVKTQTLYQNELTTPLLGSADVSDFAKDGYTLIGWTTVPGGAVVSYALGSTLQAPLASAGQTVTLYAVWQLDEITVTLSDPQQVCTVPSISVRLGGSYGALPTLTKDGWTFNGWFNERGEKIESTTLVTNGAPHTLYARWTSNYIPPAPREDDDGYSRAYRKCPRDKTCPAYIFTDLDLRLWYHDGIHFCVENGLMQGLPGSLFAPGGAATRAQLVTILWRLAGEPEAADAGFADVSPDDWFAAAVNWAEETGIVLGYGDGRFGPADPVNREQLAAVLYRCARERGDDVAKASDVSILSFEDSAEASEWAVPALQWACSTGVIAGTTESALSPKATATRAQIAAMIMRFLVEVEH